MKSFLLSAGLLTMIVSSCQQATNTKTTSAPADSTTATPLVHAGPQCFYHLFSRDTAYLQFETDNEVVSGRLEYKPFEKDKNTGTISGTITDNIIEVEYHYMSEGIMSVRKAIFKLDGDKLFEARADTTDKNGQPLFDKDYSKLRYDSIPFVKGDCK
jgi:hypothetical protein